MKPLHQFLDEITAQSPAKVLEDLTPWILALGSATMLFLMLYAYWAR